MLRRIANRNEKFIRNGGLIVDDNKGLLFIGIILIIIGLAGLKF